MLAIRWRHSQILQICPPGCVTCIVTLPWIALLALSVRVSHTQTNRSELRYTFKLNRQGFFSKKKYFASNHISAKLFLNLFQESCNWYHWKFEFLPKLYSFYCKMWIRVDNENLVLVWNLICTSFGGRSSLGVNRIAFCVLVIFSRNVPHCCRKLGPGDFSLNCKHSWGEKRDKIPTLLFFYGLWKRQSAKNLSGNEK